MHITHITVTARLVPKKTGLRVVGRTIQERDANAWGVGRSV